MAASSAATRRSNPCSTHSQAKWKPMPVEAQSPRYRAGFAEPTTTSSLRLWRHHHLDAAVLFVAERPIHLRPTLQRHAMGDDEGRIDPAVFDQLQQFRQI